MAKVESVLIVLNGRTRAIPLPEPVEISALTVKLGTEDGLVVLEPQRPLAARVLRAADKRRKTSKENVVKAAAALAERRKESDRVVAGLLGRLSPVQRPYMERLFAVLDFASAREPGSWSGAAGAWVASVLECAPEPWRLDFYFLKKWLSSPFSTAGMSDAEVVSSLSGRKPASAVFVRRAVARKLFIQAWEEQVGRSAVPPAAQHLGRPSSVQDENHPFRVISSRLKEGRIASRAALDEAVHEYEEAGLLEGWEVEEAARMADSGIWLGAVAVPGV